MSCLSLPPSFTHQIDEGEEDDDDGGDGALGDRVVHVRDDARDRLPEPRRAQRVPDRLKKQAALFTSCAPKIRPATAAIIGLD